MMQPYQPTPPAQFGRDHVSLLIYCESRSVDHGAALSLSHLRLKNDSHLWDYRRDSAERWRPAHPTRLRDGTRDNHDDVDCLADLAAAGLLSFRFDSVKETLVVALSRFGWAAAQFLRMAKAGRRSTMQHPALGGWTSTELDTLTVDGLDDHYSALLDRADPTDKTLDRFHYSGPHAQILALLGEQEWLTDAPSAWAKWNPTQGPGVRDYLIQRGLVERRHQLGAQFSELALTVMGRAVLAELAMLRAIAKDTFPTTEDNYTGPTTAADDADDQPTTEGGGA